MGREGLREREGVGKGKRLGRDESEEKSWEGKGKIKGKWRRWSGGGVVGRRWGGQGREEMGKRKDGL